MSKPAAELLPLSGKFYGSEIKLDTDEIIKIWCSGKDYTPSIREINMNGEEWEPEDSHYETEYNYQIALACVEGIIQAEKDGLLNFSKVI